MVSTGGTTHSRPSAIRAPLIPARRPVAADSEYPSPPEICPAKSRPGRLLASRVGPKTSGALMKQLRWTCPSRTNSAPPSPGVGRKTRFCSGQRVEEAHGLHRSETQGVPPTTRHLLDGEASLEERRGVDLVEGRLLPGQ